MSPGSAPGARRWLRWVLIVGVVLLVLAGGAVAFVLLHKPGNVSHPNLSFTTSTTSSTSTTARKRKVVNTFLWPRYGFDAARTRVFDGPHVPEPPFRVGWRFQDYALLEFPPVIYHNTLFFVDDNGSAKALDKRTGHKLWEKKIGTLAAASPGVGAREHLVFFPLLSTNPNAGQHPGNGRFAALSMRNGHVVWSHPIGPGTESSPLVYGRTVYFGDQGGTVRALRARDGHTLWSYHAAGAVKGGISYADGILYFGDYAGRAYALSAKTGRQIWAVSTNGAKFGFGSGEFYSSPAVAFGRVYMGNTDGRVYSFAAKTGQLAWATGTGAYVYSSPAVENTPRLGPTVYLGSYDGNFYAFDARSGAIRWTHNAGGKISGSPTIVGNVVYFSDLGTKSTAGLDVRTGRQVFSFPDGAFNPVISDYGAIYMAGYTQLYQLLPKRRHPAHRARRKAPSATTTTTTQTARK
jgi:outer membrane protein assembly factor BamB